MINNSTNVYISEEESYLYIRQVLGNTFQIS